MRQCHILEVDDASNGSCAPHARRHHGAVAGLMTTVEANGVTLGVEHFAHLETMKAAPKPHDSKEVTT